jgi:hypothetical protein
MPENDSLCDESVWLMQNLLLAGQPDLDDISRAIEKIHSGAEKISKNAS